MHGRQGVLDVGGRKQVHHELQRLVGAVLNAEGRMHCEHLSDVSSIMLEGPTLSAVTDGQLHHITNAV